MLLALYGKWPNRIEKVAVSGSNLAHARHHYQEDIVTLGSGAATAGGLSAKWAKGYPQ
jgi:hypothetical protein